MEYEDLLNEAYENVKQSSGNGERFSIPTLKVQVIGNKTSITNFSQVLSQIRRTATEVSKFLTKELATSAKTEGERLILNRKLSEKQLQAKFVVYVDKYVLCKECKKPDTEIHRKEGLLFMHCLACGAKQSLGRN